MREFKTIIYRIHQELNQHLCLRLQTHVQEYTGIDIFMKYLLISWTLKTNRDKDSMFVYLVTIGNPGHLIFVCIKYIEDRGHK